MTYNSCVETCPASECSFYSRGENKITKQSGPLRKCYSPTRPEVFKNCEALRRRGGRGLSLAAGGGAWRM